MPIDPRPAARSFAADEDGAVAVIVSLLLTVLLGFVALGVDVASLYRERAQLQSVADLAAMSAMAAPEAATARVTETISRNPRNAATVAELQTGRFLRNPAIPPAERFLPLPAGAEGINAVALSLADTAPIHFATIFAGQTAVSLDRRAMATRTGAASFSLDSHLMRLEGAALEEALSNLFSVSVSLSAADQAVLADATFDLGAFLEALAGRIGFDARNPAEILNRTVTAADAIAAAAAVLSDDAASRLAGLISVAGGVEVAVATLVGGIDTDLGLTVTEFAAGIDGSALDLLRALVVAHPSAEGTALDVGVTVEGVTRIDAVLVSGEPPAESGWIALGEAPVTLSHAAARIEMATDLDPALLGTLAVGVRAVDLSLPLYVELAGATATLEEMSCRLDGPESVAARFSTAQTPLHPANGTSVAALYLGELPDVGGAVVNPADVGFADILTLDLVIDLPLLPDLVIAGVTLQARSHATVGQSQVDRLAFTRAQIAAGETTARFGSGDLLSSGIASLFDPANTELRVKPGQEGLIAGEAGPLVAEVLALLPERLLIALAGPVDQAVDATLASAGLRLGEGELTLRGHHCELIRLVQ